MDYILKNHKHYSNFIKKRSAIFPYQWIKALNPFFSVTNSTEYARSFCIGFYNEFGILNCWEEKLKFFIVLQRSVMPC